MDASNDTLSVESRALLALWAAPGLGPKTLRDLRDFCGGALGRLLELPTRDWVPEAPVTAALRELLLRAASLARVAQRIQERCAEEGVGIAFQGEPAFPERLGGLEDAPPLLFYRGPPQPPRRRIAMVGSRHPEQGFLPYARSLARQVAEEGGCIVSGAAVGVDQACHRGALDAEGETWAFMGSALDQLDPAQADLIPDLLAGGGRVFSELPPGVRASKSSFPRRNRLISGASDAVLMLRAGQKSGSLRTAEAAVLQGRPVLALPGDVRNPTAEGCNDWIESGQARLCRGAGDVWKALGLNPKQVVRPEEPVQLDATSAEAKAAYQLLERVPRGFDDVLLRSRLDPASLASALSELEMQGLIVQHPGKLYERV